MKKPITLILISLLTLHVSQAQQGTIQLPATGQTTSYYPGDDGDLQLGVPLPANRFTDHGNGSATDELTGLMWVTDGNLIVSRNPAFDQDRTAGDGDINWKTALDYIQLLNDENYLGYNDWRMPNLVEIRSLADLGRPDTALPAGHPFFNLKSPYWSSTTTESMRRAANCYYMQEYYVHANITNMAGETQFYLKLPDLYIKDEKTLYWKFYLLPVRTSGNTGDVELPQTGQFYNYYPGDDGGLNEGTPWPSPRLVDNGDESVTDRLTGLMWAQDGNLMLTRDPDFDTLEWVDGSVTWIRALDYITKLNDENYLGYNDWRMPNRNEMTSLIDFGFDDFALPERNPFTNLYGHNAEGMYWTSTTCADETDRAWVIIMHDGLMGDGNEYVYVKDSDRHVWPVRTATDPLPSGRIDGVITLDGNPYPRAEIELSGPISSFIRTNMNGEFEFTNLPNGTYTVTPTHKYARFTPLTHQVTINGNQVNCNFDAHYTRAYGWTEISENLFPIGNATGANFADLYFIGNEGWVVNAYDFEEIYHTTDGGDTWELQTTLRPCNAIHMINEEEGYAGGESGILHKTTDGGATWNFFGMSSARITDISFTQSGTVGHTCGTNGLIGKIENGTYTTQQVSFPDYASIAFTPSGDYGWAVACFGRKSIYDNGAWTYCGGAMYFPCLNDVQFMSEEVMYLAQGYGIDRMLIGESYSRVLTDSAGYYGIFILNEDTVWAVSQTGDVILSANASDDTVHFSYDHISKEFLFDVFAVDGHNAWAVGGNGSIYRYGLLEGFPAGGADILDMVIDEQVAPAVINNENLTVWIEVEQGTDVTQLLPAVFISAGATVDPPSGSMQDFTYPVTYTVTSENGQTVNNWVVTVDITTDVAEPKMPEMVVYPNPTHGKFQITNSNTQINSKSQNSISKLEVVDIYGKVAECFNLYPVTRNPQLDISHFPTGIYFIRISLENQIIVKKIIKM